LSVTSILLPSLKDSRDDIPLLVQNFIEFYNEQMGKKVLGFKEEIMERLKTYGWPGNIRELRNAVEFAIMLNQGEQFIPWEHMPGHLRLPLLYQKKVLENQVDDPLNTERESINRSEKALVKKAIDLSNGRMNEAAKILGISRATIYRKIKKLGIAPYN
jgi:DNA-binding NtrC family response regulator